jgi:chromosome segregation ATPase
MYEVEFDQPRKFSMHLLDASLKKLDAHHKLFKKPGESGPAYEIRNLKRDLQKSEIDRKKAQTQYEQLKTDLDSREDNSDHLRKELAAAKTELRRQAEDKDKEIDDLNSTIEDLRFERDEAVRKADLAEKWQREKLKIAKDEVRMASQRLEDALVYMGP